MGIWARLRNLGRTRREEPGAWSWFLPQRVAGVTVTAEEALRVSTVYACLNVIASAIASSPWQVFRETDAGDREMLPRSLAWRLLNVAPNPEMTAFSFRETAVFQAGLFGNFYAEIARDQAGRPAALWPVDNRTCTLRRDPGGALVLDVHGGGGFVRLPYRDVFHLRLPGFDGLAGFAPVELASRTIGHAAAAEIFGAAFYGNGTQPGGILTSPTNLNQQQIDQLRAQIDAQHRGPDKAARLMFLGGGLDFKPLSTSPNQAQFVETRQFLIEEVCRFYNVPPHKVQHLLRATFSNIEHQGLDFVRSTLTPWAERLRQEADVKLTSREPAVRTRLDIEWMAEGDAGSMAQADSALIVNGIATRNEIRRRRALPPVPGGEAVTVQMQTMTLDRASAPPEPAPAPAVADDEDDAADGGAVDDGGADA